MSHARGGVAMSHTRVPLHILRYSVSKQESKSNSHMTDKYNIVLFLREERVFAVFPSVEYMYYNLASNTFYHHSMPLSYLYTCIIARSMQLIVHGRNV